MKNTLVAFLSVAFAFCGTAMNNVFDDDYSMGSLRTDIKKLQAQ